MSRRWVPRVSTIVLLWEGQTNVTAGSHHLLLRATLPAEGWVLMVKVQAIAHRRAVAGVRAVPPWAGCSGIQCSDKCREGIPTHAAPGVQADGASRTV